MDLYTGTEEYDERANEPTVPQIEGLGETVPQTAAVALDRRPLLLYSDVTFSGDSGREFVLKASEVIAADGGEAQVYACYTASDPKKYAARIVLSVTPESDFPKRRTRLKVLDFLKRVGHNDNTHILPLVDEGSVDIGGKDYYVEIYPYCAGGDYGHRHNVSYDELCREVIPALNTALHHFHEAGLIYRDLKPGNIYKYNGQVVIGDFGISCDMTDGFATDKEKTGTLGYYAPELMSGAAKTASDYYSLGQTLWTLYHGDMMYERLIRAYRDEGPEAQRAQINDAMMSDRYYDLDDIAKVDAFFEVLIRGLLKYAPSNRFGYEQVNRWLAGDKSVANELPDMKFRGIFTKPFKIFGVDCWDDNDVWKVLCRDWERSRDFVLNGHLRDFYLSQDSEKAGTIESIVNKCRKGESRSGNDTEACVALAKIILFLSKNEVLFWKGRAFQKTADLGLIAEKERVKSGFNNSAYAVIATGLAEEWYAHIPGAKKETLNELNDIRTMLLSGYFGEETALLRLMYQFGGKDGECRIFGCRNLDEFVRYWLKDPKNVYGSGETGILLDSPDFFARLCALGYGEAVKVLLDAFFIRSDGGKRKPQPYLVKYELFFSFLELNTERSETKKLIRNFYHDYGPKAYLSWWRDNLGYYAFEGPEARILKEEIASAGTDPDAPLQVQRKQFERLEGLANRFDRFIEADLFLGSIGIKAISDDYVFCDNLSGTWGYEFLGQRAPVGFKYHLGL